MNHYTQINPNSTRNNFYFALQLCFASPKVKAKAEQQKTPNID